MGSIVLWTCIVLNTLLLSKWAIKFSAKRSKPGLSPWKELFECIAHQREVDVNDTTIWSNVCIKGKSSVDFGWRLVK